MKDWPQLDLPLAIFLAGMMFLAGAIFGAGYGSHSRNEALHEARENHIDAAMDAQYWERMYRQERDAETTAPEIFPEPNDPEVCK